MKTFVCWLLSLLCLTGSAHYGRAATYNFQTFAVTGLSPTTAAEIDNAGRVYGFAGSPSSGYVTSDLTTFTTFLAPGATYSPVQGANDAGQTVGRANSGPSSRDVGYVRNANGTFPILNLEPPNSTRAYPRGINNAGTIVVGDYDDSTLGAGLARGFIADISNPLSPAYTTVNVPGAAITFVNKRNETGLLVGSYQTSAAAPTTTTPERSFFTADGITFSTFVHPLATTRTVVYGVNDFGAMVGFYRGSDNLNHGFLTLDGIAFDDSIVVPGSSAAVFRDINNAGQIVGSVRFGNTVDRGLVATPVPEPTTLGLALLALTASISLHRKIRN